MKFGPRRWNWVSGYANKRPKQWMFFHTRRQIGKEHANTNPAAFYPERIRFQAQHEQGQKLKLKLKLINKYVREDHLIAQPLRNNFLGFCSRQFDQPEWAEIRVEAKLWSDRMDCSETLPLARKSLTEWVMQIRMWHAAHRSGKLIEPEWIKSMTEKFHWQSNCTNHGLHNP